MCEYCNGEGHYLYREESGRTYYTTCKHCDAYKTSRINFLKSQSQLPAITDYSTEQARKYVESFKQLAKARNNWAVFSGKAGAGKTTQAVWIAHKVIERYGVSVRYINAMDWTRRLISLKKKQAEYDKFFNSYMSAGLVVIDDFMKSIPRTTSFEYEEVRETILETFWARYDARKPLIVTTQAELAEISNFDEALFGRITEMSEDRVYCYNDKAINWRLPNTPMFCNSICG